MHEVLVNRFGGLSLPWKSVVRLTDRPDMTLDVYRGRKTTLQPTNMISKYKERDTKPTYTIVYKGSGNSLASIFSKGIASVQLVK